MSWPAVKLSELVYIQIGKTPSRSEDSYWRKGIFPWLSIRDMSQGESLLSTAECITDKAVSDTNIKIAKAGTVLFSFKLSIGKVGIAKRDLFHNEAIAAFPIKDERRLYAPYLVCALKVLDYSRSTDRAVMGATLNKKKLAELEIPLPPLSIQKKIAAMLAKADLLCKQAKQVESELNQLAQSLFLEMFGDPASNPKGWSSKFLEDIGLVVGGLQVTAKRKDNPVELPYLRVANVYRDQLRLDEIKSIRVTERELTKCLLSKGDILIVEGHGNKEEVGRCAVWDGSISNCTHQNHLIKLRLGDNALPEFVSAYLNSAVGRRQLLKSSKTTSGLNTISTKNVKQCMVYLPPLDLQSKYVNALNQLSKERACALATQKSFEELFLSLQQKAFNGELNFDAELALTE